MEGIIFLLFLGTKRQSHVRWQVREPLGGQDFHSCFRPKSAFLSRWVIEESPQKENAIMTNQQKDQITALRSQGYGYKKIAQIMELSDNTVKSFCKRNNVSSPVTIPHKESCCPQCGREIIQTGKTKKRRFCSDECRKLWWKEHPNLSSKTAVYSFVCAECGNRFTAYGNRNRKFCCHDCYV